MITTAPDAALLWAREQHAEVCGCPEIALSILAGNHDIRLPITLRADAFRAGQAHERRANAGLLAALEALVAHCHEQERLITEEMYNVDYCGESLPLCNARAAINAAKGLDNAEG